MKAIVLGASGLVGSHLVQAGKVRDHVTIIGTNRSGSGDLRALDLADAAATDALLRSARPSVVFLAAADANVDRCERDPAAAAGVNVDAPRTVAGICRDIGALLVYYSTDYVFDGTEGPYSEEDRPNPIGVYGVQKTEAEALIRQMVPLSHLILRTTVVYGTDPGGKNFLIRLLENLRNQTTIRVPTDQIGSPTFVNDLADASWQLVEAGARGTFHVAGSERMDRYAFALLAARTFQLDPSPIAGVTTRELDQLAARPLSAGLRVDKVQTFLGRPMTGASEGLASIARSGSL